MNNLKVGDTVYHVENPDVPGVIYEIPSGSSPHYLGSFWVWVDFQKPVKFTEAAIPGEKVRWNVSACLLHSSKEEAQKNSK